MKQFAALLFLILFSYDGLMAQPGKPEYCIPSANCTFGDGISDFIFAGIENLSNGCSHDGYGDFTIKKATVEIGETYTASFSSAYDNQKVSLWIDLDSDSIFSDFERFVTDLDLETAGQFHDAEITFPLHSRAGIYRMRVGANWVQPSSADPCADFSYGEWEDYLLEVTGNPVRTNVAVASIEMPPIMKAEPVRPWAVVINQGLDTVLSKITMRELTTGYRSTVTLWKFPPGLTKWVRFDTLDLLPGKYHISVYAELEGDEIPGDDFLSKPVIFSDQPHQKVIAEFFTGTWSSTCPNAADGLDLLKQEYADSLAVVAWHVGDVFENQHSLNRDASYRIAGYPTIWFDGWQSQSGAYYPNNYHYLRPYMKQRLQQYSNFEIDLQLTEVDQSTLNVNTTIRIIHGHSAENLAAYVILTESNIPSPGHDKQNFVVRAAYPNASTGIPLDFLSQKSYICFTQFNIQDNYILDNCEIVVFLQNMDTREIYQGNSRMAWELTSINEVSGQSDMELFPNPASDWLTINTQSKIGHIWLSNLYGEIVFESIMPVQPLTIKLENNIKSGMYLVKVQTENGMLTEILVIQ